MEASAPVPASQASSHFPLEPLSASVLADKEARRRDAATALGACGTGCPDLDDYVLLGGFERGSVVGLSAEDEEMGVKLGLQTLAHSLCGEGSVVRGLVVTPKPAGAILGGLRDAVRAELKAGGAAEAEVAAKTRAGLERVMLSCVFDLDGLWEVLADLDRPAEGGTEEEKEGNAGEEDSPREEYKVVVDEIGDSQDEDDGFDDDDDEPPPPPPDALPQLQPRPEQQPPRPATPPLPDIIVVTHFSSLLTSLFTHREKAAAHSTLQLLGAHLRDLTRNLPSSPLVLLLNSTSSPTTSAAADAQKKAALDPTLRSIFNPPPPPGYAAAAHHHHARRSKPSFGLVFAQLLDLHLLCTRLPRARDDAEAAFRADKQGARTAVVVVVEVLLDEMGVWEGRKGREGQGGVWGGGKGGAGLRMDGEDGGWTTTITGSLTEDPSKSTYEQRRQNSRPGHEKINRSDNGLPMDLRASINTTALFTTLHHNALASLRFASHANQQRLSFQSTSSLASYTLRLRLLHSPSPSPTVSIPWLAPVTTCLPPKPNPLAAAPGPPLLVSHRLACMPPVPASSSRD
ncbi:hypothetical protein AK830_g7387 [Neonectria ditissima]|uniref:Uncharacterized protein n=1 Tax=Neonectria ditissima TaxID=78410 RepID=A0A0P7AZR2_9HYPO|nr:hypothetical protein AK830_g7387 [Neonectria ditissima]